MLRSYSDTHVINSIRDTQDRQGSDTLAKQEQDMFAVTVVQAAIELLQVHGFVVGRQVREPQDSKLKLADLVLERWKATALKQRQAVRQAHPELGVLLDQLEVGDAPS